MEISLRADTIRRGLPLFPFEKALIVENEKSL